MKKINSGFTLIELLVVIAIIGVLSSIVIANLNDARAKARDAKAKSDFTSLRTALALYYNTNGRYPNETPVATNPWTDNFNSMAQQLVTAGFLSSVPVAPLNHPYNYYNYGGNVIGGLLVTFMETMVPTAAVSSGTCKPFSTGNWCDTSYVSTYYCICNPY